MTCKKCGKEYLNFEKECPYCGAAPTDEVVTETPVVEAAPVNNVLEVNTIGNTSQTESIIPESQVLGVCAIIFSALCASWIGLVLAIVGLLYYKQPEGKKKCKIALVIFVIEMILAFFLGIVLGMMGYGQQ